MITVHSLVAEPACHRQLLANSEFASASQDTSRRVTSTAMRLSLVLYMQCLRKCSMSYHDLLHLPVITLTSRLKVRGVRSRPIAFTSVELKIKSVN